MMNVCYWLATRLLRILFPLFYPVRIYGLQNLTPGKALLAPNHVSFLDPPFLAHAAWPEEMHYLADIYLFRHVFKWLLRGFNAYPTGDIKSFKKLYLLLLQGKKIVIFPEGGMSATGELQPFKLGLARLALRTQSPVIPVYISGTFEAWTHHSSLQVGMPLACVFGKPIAIEPYLGLSKKEAQEALTKDVRQAMEGLRNQLLS